MELVRVYSISSFFNSKICQKVAEGLDGPSQCVCVLFFQFSNIFGGHAKQDAISIGEKVVK
jgi:hypothetical protein